MPFKLAEVEVISRAEPVLAVWLAEVEEDEEELEDVVSALAVAAVCSETS